jgi:hypothetical protein
LAQTEVFFYREPKDDSVPLLQWLEDLPSKVQAKCIERIDRLGELGHEVRRPEADFAGRRVVVVSHGLTKGRRVPPREIERAVDSKQLVEADFEKFTFRPE